MINDKNRDIIRKLGIHEGSNIKIIKMSGHPEMSGRIGKVIKITPEYQLEGTWGNRSIVPFTDKIEVVCEK